MLLHFVAIYEIKSHLGHKPQDLDITSVYTPYNPTYLKAAAEGIDDYFDDLRADFGVFGDIPDT